MIPTFFGIVGLVVVGLLALAFFGLIAYCTFLGIWLFLAVYFDF